MFAFHVDVPQGVDTLDVSLDFLSAIGAGGFSSASSETAHLGIYSWNQVLLYPQGARTDDVMFRASMQLPAGWKFGTALPVAEPERRQGRFRAGVADDAGRFTCHRGRVSCAWCRSTPSSRPVEADLVGDTASVDRHSERSDAEMEAAGAGSGRDVRRAPLHQLSLPADAERPRRALRPRASSVERLARAEKTRSASRTRSASSHTSTSTRGTASTAVPQGLRRPTSSSRWSASCCGCTRG